MLAVATLVPASGMGVFILPFPSVRLGLILVPQSHLSPNQQQTAEGSVLLPCRVQFHWVPSAALQQLWYTNFELTYLRKFGVCGHKFMWLNLLSTFKSRLKPSLEVHTEQSSNVKQIRFLLGQLSCLSLCRQACAGWQGCCSAKNYVLSPRRWTFVSCLGLGNGLKRFHFHGNPVQSHVQWRDSLMLISSVFLTSVPCST